MNIPQNTPKILWAKNEEIPHFQLYLGYSIQPTNLESNPLSKTGNLTLYALKMK